MDGFCTATLDAVWLRCRKAGLTYKTAAVPLRPRTLASQFISRLCVCSLGCLGSLTMHVSLTQSMSSTPESDPRAGP